MISTFTLYILASLSILFFLYAVIWSFYSIKRDDTTLKDRNNNSNRDVEKGINPPTENVKLQSKFSGEGNNQSKMDQLLFLQSLYSINSNDETSSSSDEDISEWTSLLTAYRASKTTLTTIKEN